jgi:hypothetical protein
MEFYSFIEDWNKKRNFFSLQIFFYCFYLIGFFKIWEEKEYFAGDD